MEEMAMRKSQLLLRRRKGYARPRYFLKDLTQVFKNCNPREAFHGWWPVWGRASSQQGPAKLLLHLAMKRRGDNCKKRGRIAEGTREEFPGTMEGATVQNEDPAARCDGNKVGGIFPRERRWRQ